MHIPTPSLPAVFSIWVLTSSLLAADTPPTHNRGIAEFLIANCTGCHDQDSLEGDLNLATLPWTLDDPDNFHLWERVFDRVRLGEMPPDEEVDATETSAFLESLHDVLNHSDATRISITGRVPARRLTRAQYERNVCDLLGIRIPLSEYLPPDSLTNGFDTVAVSQQISNHTMAAYLQAADVALDAAFGAILTETSPSHAHLTWKELRRNERRTGREPEGRPRHKDIVSWSTRQNFYGRMPATSVPTSGRYRIRLRAQAVNPPADGHIWCSVRSGLCSAKASTLYWIDSFTATKNVTEHEFEAWIQEGHMLQILPNDRGLRTVPVPSLNRPAGSVAPMKLPGVAIKWIDMERIDADVPQVRQSLIGDLSLRPVATNNEHDSRQTPHQFEIVSKTPDADMRRLIHDFAQRAFRRPLEHSELTRYVDFARARFQTDRSLQAALRAAYRALLCSSRFLYFEESVGPLDDHALASRLSHFLWGTTPDPELRQLAENGRLRDANVLRQQTERMLKAPQSHTFIEEFTDQWLELYEINSTTPDGKLYSEYDDVLHHSLVEETRAFVRELIDKDLPVSNVVDSDFTFLNSRLARHYNIVWPGGTGLQRVQLDPSSRRGGIITHASVLKVTANGTTTSPIIRGVWMLERIMGQHVQPPPANVPAVEPDIRGATSIRDQLDRHRNLESCAACHVKIDPPGFALENYDVIGGWRDNYRAVATRNRRGWSDGPPVDPAHRLSSGETFENIDGLKKLLAAQPAMLARNLASHLITYSTGAAPTFADRKSLDEIVSDCRRSGYGVRSLVHSVVQSPLFQTK